MPRSDLLALTPDDLAALTNRGTVKRALRELESGEVTFTLTETDAGEVTVEWSDDSRCVIPAGKTAAEARCTCPATTLCRHAIRSILAYQKQASAAASSDAADQEPTLPQPWNPGDITDEALAQHLKKPALAAAQSRFQQGLLIELIRSAKPSARFHQLACSVRFLVPGDVRYTHCDCAEAPPCSHVPLAVWAFRQLPPDRLAGIVSTQQADLNVPAELLDAGESLLEELVENGIASLPPTWKDRVLRLEPACVDAELIWPAEVLADLVQQYERYAAHDARFAPQRVAELAGEWLIRADAIRSRTRAVPQLLVRGSSADRATDIGSARYIGLGCGVEQDRAGVTVTAYLQDSDSGSIVAIAREFPNPPKDSTDKPRDFPSLADWPVVRGISLAALGRGQLLLQGGKRAADHRLIVGRAKASANPQNFAWESLRAPLLAEDFAELRARLGTLPPASLRPRYVAEDLHVVPIAAVLHAAFDEAMQSVEIIACDARQEPARIHHPFLWRGREGCEALLTALADPQRRLCFVAGQVRSSAAGLVIHPITLVFEGGPTRQGLMPWVERNTAASAGTPVSGLPAAPDEAINRAVEETASQATSPMESNDPILSFPAQILSALGELLLLGLRRADAQVARQWSELARRGEALGYDRLVHPLAQLAQALDQKLRTTAWTAKPACKIALHMALLARLAADLSQQP